MKNSLRVALRALIISTVFAAPMVGLAVAQNDGAKDMSGAGFVLYVSLSRP